jgi:hypothetical protein
MKTRKAKLAGGFIVLAIIAGTWLYKKGSHKTLWTDGGPAPPPPSNEEVVELSGCITLDTSPDSDKFLGCVKEKLDKEDIPYMTNQKKGSISSLRQALDNLASDSCKNTSKAMVIGHGQPGFIHVDGGDYYVDDRASVIADVQDGGADPQPWNETEWGEFVRNKLQSRFTKIILLGCDTGSQRNNKLLQTIATRSAAAVTAPKGKVWCDPNPLNRRVIIDKTIGWSNVSKEGVVEQLDQREKQLLNNNLEIGNITTPSPKLQTLLSAPDLTVSLCLRSNPAHKFDRDPPCKPLPIGQQKFLIQSIFQFKNPFQTGYISGADKTGKIVLSSEGMNLSIDLDILNDDLVNDIESQSYYHVSDQLTNSWKILIQ